MDFQTPQDMPPRSLFTWRPTSEQLAGARAIINSVRQQTADYAVTRYRLTNLRRELATILGSSRDHVAELLQVSGISDPLCETLVQERIDQFINAAYTLPPRPTAVRPASTAKRAPHRNKDRQEQRRREHTPELQGHQQKVSIRRQKREQRRQEQVEMNRALFLTRISSSPSQPHRDTRVITSQSARRVVSNPACQRIIARLSSAGSSRLTADFYQAITELTLYGSTPFQRKLSQIAADEFGIHADTVTAAQLHAQAVRAIDEKTAGALLDELGRLGRRPRGLFYDGHRDWISLWDSTEQGIIHLYTCTGPELRRCAAAAVEYGDLVIPPIRHQIIDDRYLPTGPEDPALILAQAAAQLGRQAAAAMQNFVRGNDRQTTPPPPSVSASSSPDQLRRVSAAVWVIPVAGAGEYLSVGHLDESYARYVAGPRSRAAALVREHKRRRAGAGPGEPPSITVRSHLRRGIGPAEQRPSVTRVRGRSF